MSDLAAMTPMAVPGTGEPDHRCLGTGNFKTELCNATYVGLPLHLIWKLKVLHCYWAKGKVLLLTYDHIDLLGKVYSVLRIVLLSLPRYLILLLQSTSELELFLNYFYI